MYKSFARDMHAFYRRRALGYAFFHATDLCERLEEGEHRAAFSRPPWKRAVPHPNRAHSLMASRNGSMMQTFAVTVPPGIGAGQQFQASLDGQLTMVIVPHGSSAGSTLHVQIPVRPSSVQKYAVTIPVNVRPGDRFQANLGGQLVWLRCPPQLGPGKQMLVDANSATQENGRNAKSWPPPIAVPESIDGAPNARAHYDVPSSLAVAAARAARPARTLPLRPLPLPSPFVGARARASATTPSSLPHRVRARSASAAAARTDEDVPDYFLCPITGCIMRQPAMTPDGVTYDYDAITEWLSNKKTDPSTNLPLDASELCPNRTVRSMIEDFIAKGPDFLMKKTKEGH